MKFPSPFLSFTSFRSQSITTTTTAIAFYRYTILCSMFFFFFSFFTSCCGPISQGSPLLPFSFPLLGGVLGQTIPQFMTCRDIREKCILDCVHSVYLGLIEESAVYTCRESCRDEHDECKDPLYLQEVLHCVEGCARIYDGALNDCLSLINRSTKNTYNAGMDECSIYASQDYEECSGECYGSHFDIYDKWNPAKEESLQHHGAGKDTSIGTNEQGEIELHSQRFYKPKQKIERDSDGEVQYLSYTTIK